MKQNVSPFQRLWTLGYRHLIPIIPPKADLWPDSSLARRLAAGRDDRGKTPGTHGHDGLWRGMNWVKHVTTEEDLEEWDLMCAGVGLKLGHDGVIGLDADLTVMADALAARKVVERLLGELPVRIGRDPKAMYFCRVRDPIGYMRIEAAGGQRFEVLGMGRQAVTDGNHPGTGRPYHWPRPLPPIDELPVFSAAQIEELLEELRKVLPEPSPIVKVGGDQGSAPPQEGLRGDIETVRQAVRLLPNTEELFPAYDNMVKIGEAIHAACADDLEAGREIWHEWASRWPGEGKSAYDPDTADDYWNTFRAPHRIGAGYLYDLAEKHGGGAFSAAAQWFEEIKEDDSPFALANQSKPFVDPSDVYPVLRINDIISRPPQKFLVARHIPEVSVGFLYSEPGAGKSFLALDLALHIAFGLPDWHGDAINADPDSVVVYIASEGSHGFRNRIQAWLKEHKIEGAVPGQNLSKPFGGSERFLLIEQTINFMVADDIDRLLRTVRSAIGRRPCLIFVDTVSRSMPGADENLQKEMTLFVRACDRLKEAFGGAVLGIHHAGKNGDMRGSSVLRGAGDFVFRLRRKMGATIGSLECEKQKDGPDGWEQPYRFDLVNLEKGETSLVPFRCESSVGPAIAVTPDMSGRILGAMRAAWDAGEPWSQHARAGERWAGRRMAGDFGIDAVKAGEIVSTWLGAGIIAEEMYDTHKKRRGLRVLVDKSASDSADIFN